MSKIAVQPITLHDVELSIDVDDYAAHVSKVELVPTYPQSTWKGLSPDSVHSSVGSPSWVATLEYAQDWTTPKSLARYLFAHQGQTKSVVFKPQAGVDMPAWLVDVVIVSGPVGGTVDTTATGSVSCPVKGQPVPDYDDNPVTPNPAD